MGQILVTGATGFLGGALVRQLVAQKFDVVATGRNPASLFNLPLPDRNKFAWDIRSAPGRSLLEKLKRVETIIHCAAFSSAWGRDIEFWASNVDGTVNCLDLASKLNVGHFIHISTPAIYFEFEDQLGIVETQSLPEPVNAYAHTKAIAEQKVRESGLPFSIIRPRGIYGKGDTALLPRLLRAAQSGPLPYFRNGAAHTDITHVDDVVLAITLAMVSKKSSIGQVFNVSGGVSLSIESIVEKACAANGTQVRWRNLPVAPTLALVRLNERFARLRNAQTEPRVTAYGLGIFAFSQTLDISKASRMLNWRPQISFDEGLARTFIAESGRAA